MYRISDEQVNYILSDIRKRGVAMEDLQYNLLDHICCILEQEMNEGDDFETNYQQVVKRFYKKELYEIEKETILLLTFKNYYAMKKFMNLSGAFAAILFITGSFFKIMHWPTSAMQLFTAIFVFSVVFLPLLLLIKTKEASGKREKLVLGISVFVVILYGLSTLLLVQHWPGARIMWYSTLLLAFLVLLPLYFFSGIRRPETKANTIVTAILLLGFLGMQFAITGIRPSPETYGKIYTWQRSEELLHAAQQSGAIEPSLADINNICERLKALIVQHDFGMKAIPADAEQRGMRFSEKNMEAFFGEGEGLALLEQLRDKVNGYNARAANQIPVANSLVQPGFTAKSYCSSLFVLNNITQLQLAVVSLNR